MIFQGTNANYTLIKLTAVIKLWIFKPVQTKDLCLFCSLKKEKKPRTV